MQPWKQALQSAPNLAAIPSLINEVPLGALPLSGGLTNRCWRVFTSSYGWLVWRASTEHCQLFDVDRINEKKRVTQRGRVHCSQSCRGAR